MHKLPVTAVILTKNEEEMIVGCLKTVQWCQEVLVIDQQSTDNTVSIAKKLKAIVYTSDAHSFSQLRNYGLSKVRTPWLLYLDADERVTPALSQEIQSVIKDEKSGVFSLKRKNIHYGKEFRHGGWENDWVTRLFSVKALKGWKGNIHESPVYEGEVEQLNHQLIHLTHRNMVDGLTKSLSWTGLEAELLHQSQHPPVTAFMLFRKTIMEFIRRAILWKGEKDGIEGWIEAGVQAMNRFIVYQRLWELQQKPSLSEKYRNFDQKISSDWETLDHES